MRTALLASAAMVGLLFAVPAFADHDHGGGGGGSGGSHGGGGGSHGGGAPAAIPSGGGGSGRNSGGGQGGWTHGGNGGASPFAGGTGHHHTGAPFTTPGGTTVTRGDRGNFTPGTRGTHNFRGANGLHGTNGRGFNGHGNYARYNRNWTATQRFHFGHYHRPPGWYYRRWSYGDFLPALFFAQSYWINDYDQFDLDEPPPGAVWVRYGSDAILVDEDSGQVIQVAYGVFY